MFVSLDGRTVHGHLEGEGQLPPLVLVHSLGSDLRIWDEVAALLAPRFRMLRYDLRGHGLSDATPAPYSIAELGDDLVRLLDHAAVAEVVVMGISVGGTIALDLGARHPERIRAMVLCDTGLRIGSEASWDDRIEEVRARGLSEMATEIVGRWFAPGYAQRQPAAYGGYRNMLARTSEEGYLGTCAALRDADYRETAGAVDVPALVVTGSEDLSTPPETGRELAAALPRGAFEKIEDAGHLPCVERPGPLVDVVAPFLEEHGDGGAR